MREMFRGYDKDLMRRGAAARECIAAGEDPYRMLLQVVCPDRDWSEAALLATLTWCPQCEGQGVMTCPECGGTGFVSTDRRKMLSIEALADFAYDAA
jgi:hypothetical protein